MKKLFKFGVRLGVLAVVIAIVLKALDDREELPPQPVVATPEPPRPAPPEPKPEPAAPEAAVTWVEPQGDVCPMTHPIKAKLSSKVFRKPDASGYATSKPDRCYASADAAVAEGFREAKR